VAGSKASGYALNSPAAPATNARAPEIMGFTLGMPIDAAVRHAQSLAPAGSVTLPPVKREAFVVISVEAPAALAPPPPEPATDSKKDGNFYLLLNAAPRLLKSQPTRSSHVEFITLVADRDERRLVRVVFEPSLVYWPNGFDAARRTPAQLVDWLRQRYAAEVQLVSAGARDSAGRDDRERQSNTRERPGASPATAATGWALRVYANNKSVVLTDPLRVSDYDASRLKLD
jgi:hypothetical protein